MGINGVFSKIIPLDATSITQLRSVIAAIALVIFTLLQKRTLRLDSPRQYAVVLGLGVLLALHWSSFFHAMQSSTVAIGILAHYSYPVLTVIAEPLLNKRSPELGDVLAGCLVLVGVAIMVPNWTMGSDVLVGVSFGLISAVCFGSRNILQRRWLQDAASSSVMLYQLLIVAVVTTPFVNINAVVQLSLSDWLLLLFLGVVSTALTHTMVAMSLRALSAKTVSLISCLQPPSAIFLTWLFLNEVPSLTTLAGGAIILAAATYESVKSSRRFRTAAAS